MSESLLRSAVASASYNMILQLVFRLLTFLVNACILRYISRDVLGVVNVRLTLLYTTIMFLSREALKRACLTNTNEKDWRQTINLIWCSVPTAMLFGWLLSLVWLQNLAQPDPSKIPHYPISVALFALASVIELTSEPLWLVGQAFLFVKLKVLIEGTMMVVRCLLSILLVIWRPELGILGFSIAHVIGSLFFPVLYYSYFTYYINRTSPAEIPDGFPFSRIRHFFPRIEDGKPFCGAATVNLAWSFFKQSLLKQLLTEGERYAMTVFNILSFGDQGTFDVVSNLGSLVARFVFLPIEDSGYLFFSQSLIRGQPAVKQKPESLQLACNVLETLLSLVTLIGVTILSFGYAYSQTLLYLYGGTLLSEGTGPLLLRWFCLYVCFLAVNGVTECFVFACMSQHDVDKYNKKMLIFSAAFLLSSYYLAKSLGAVGFILANCLNMLLRIAHSIYYIHKFTSESPSRPLRGLSLSSPVLLVYFLSFCITAFTETKLVHLGLLYRLVHIIIGCGCVLVVAVIVYTKEERTINFILAQFQRKKKD